MEVAAWWGAIFSTIFGIVKLWESWNQRFRIEIGRFLTSDPQIGNEIFVRNLAHNPIILSDWEILSREGRWPFQRYSTLCSREIGDGDSRIEANSTLTFKFQELNHFDWGSGRRIFIRLHFSGKRPILRKIIS
ncbi:MAG: hypothetical protein IH831_04695 [Planctomycetes bacterium]|nr:hypothetical protein [Planctomycetota bacterium]